jgi:DNA-binding protein H-NS
MPKSYAQVLKQIETLRREAERLKRQEVEGVVARIREAISTYGLTASDLGLASGRATRGVARSPSKKLKRTKSKSTAAVRFRDGAGNTWVGRGPRPRWLRNALASGKKLEDFAV